MEDKNLIQNSEEEIKREAEQIKADLEEINLKKNRKLFKKYLLFFVIVFLLIGSFFLGYKKGQAKPTTSSKNVPITGAVIQNKTVPSNLKVDFSLFWKVWNLVKEKHIDSNKLDAQKMVYGAINGMLKATGDPYTDFFNPQQSKDFSLNIEGSFEGIGAELGVRDNILTVIAPLDGSPAKKAGLRAGDKIIKINDKAISDLSIDQAVDLIRGKKGTTVKLTILHEGNHETKDISITRDTIEIKSVALKSKKNGIAYVRITQFSENTDKEFDQVMNKIIAEDDKGIVLDLRNNPGGLLNKAVAIASRLIPRGKVVVSEEDSSGKKDSLHTTGGDKLSSLPIVVLINEGSASAAEILSGALKDDRGITLIGVKSFGKGSVQQLMNLPGGSSVKITVAKWLTPNGDYIMKKGIKPDVEVKMTADDYKNNRDPQLDKAMELIKNKINKK